MQFGFVAEETTLDGHKIVTGPYPSLKAAEVAGKGSEVVEWDTDGPGPGRPCRMCGADYTRLPMPDDTARVYDALFPAVLNWREDDDCGMAGLMRDVAEAAAAALRDPAGA